METFIKIFFILTVFSLQKIINFLTNRKLGITEISQDMNIYISILSEIGGLIMVFFKLLS